VFVVGSVPVHLTDSVPTVSKRVIMAKRKRFVGAAAKEVYNAVIHFGLQHQSGAERRVYRSERSCLSVYGAFSRRLPVAALISLRSACKVRWA